MLENGGMLHSHVFQGCKKKYSWGEINTTGDVSLSVNMIGDDLFYIQARSKSCKDEEFEF